MRGFFTSRVWRNRLIGAAATSLVSGAVAGAQDAGFISRRTRMPILGVLSGAMASGYARTGRVTVSAASDMRVPILMTFFQIALTELSSPFFEGDRVKAQMWSATTVACVCAGLAACITPP